MTHEKAFSLVQQFAPAAAGMLWNTTNRAGADTAWAVADQYGDDEIDAATADLRKLAAGETPDGWEPLDTEQFAVVR